MSEAQVELTMETLESGLDAGKGFMQNIRMQGPGGAIATATWSCTDLAAGVVQIVDLSVKQAHQRRGIGGRMLSAIIDQASKHHRDHHAQLRRLWMSIAQKSQVNARAFATANGFTHVGTVQQLLREQDMLIYMRTFD